MTASVASMAAAPDLPPLDRRQAGYFRRGHDLPPKRQRRKPQRRVPLAWAQAMLRAALAGAWVLGAVGQAQAGDPYSYSRSVAFSYRANGMLESEIIEPGQAQLCVKTSYAYDAYGNKATDDAGTAASTTAGCSGAAGLAQFSARTSTAVYAQQTGRIGHSGGTAVTIAAGTFANSSSNALGHTQSRTYDPRFGVVLSLTGPNGLSTTWEVDDFGRVVAQKRADGTRSATYHCWLAGKSFYGVAIDTGTNTTGCPTPGTAEVPADAVRFEHRVDQDSGGTAISAFTRSYFDRAGRLLRSVSESPDSGALIAQDTDYSANGIAILSTQPYFLYSGRSVTGEGDADYGMTLSEYDALGRVTATYTTAPASGSAPDYPTGGTSGGSQTSVSFAGRGTRQAQRTRVTYAGLSSTITDDLGRTRREEKNPEGKLVRTTDALGAQTTHQHDAFGNLVLTLDPLGNKVAIEYDIRGRKTLLNDPDAGVSAYCWDALGQLKAQQSSKQRGSHATTYTCPSAGGAGSTAPDITGWTSFAYDLLGRMTQRREPEYTTTWSYDSCSKGVGKLCKSATSHGITRQWVYDSLGRALNQRTDISGGPSFASALAYDASTGRLASQTYPTGLKLGYSYTQRGHLSQVRLATKVTLNPLPATPGGTPVAARTLEADTPLWSSGSLNAWGSPQTASYDNGVVNRVQLEPQSGQLLGLTAGSGSSSTVVDQRYVWNSVGQLSQRVDALGDAGIQVLDTLAYDALGRLNRYQVSGGGGSRDISLQYNALGLLLYESNVGRYTYAAQGVANGRPHAVQSVAGSAASYGWDLNGNAVTASGGKWRSISYTSFNLPDGSSGIQGPAGTPKSTWQYDENHQRIREDRSSAGGTRTTWYLHPDNQGALAFEREIAANGSQSNRHYLSAGGSVFAVLVTTGALPSLGTAQTDPGALGATAALKLEYWHKDHLGSLIATTDHAANVTARYAYDPFGKRRQTNAGYDAFGSLVVDWTTNTNKGPDRGFTGHEHLDELGLVHMNGRLFDPTIARFLQPDPLVQEPSNLQNFDRYAYCFNSPTTCTDPSGFLSDYLKNPVRATKYIDPIANYVLTKSARNKYGYQVGTIAIGIVSLYCNAWYAACVAGGTAAWATFAGASDEQAFKSGAIAGVTAWAMNSVGNATSNTNGAPRSGWQIAGNVAGHAAVGCASSAAGGGSCRSGAIGAAVGATYSNYFEYSKNIVVDTMQHAMIGGLSAELSGGSFEDGARSAAMGYLFNELMHQTTCVQQGHCSKVYRDGTVCPAGKPCYNPLGTDTGSVLVGVTLEASTFVLDYSLTVDTDGRGYGSLGRSLLPNGDVGGGLKFHFAPEQWSSDQKFQFFDGMSATASAQLGPVSVGRSYSPVAGTSRFVSTTDLGVGSPGLRLGGSVSLSTCLWGCPK